ncbi:MAG: hypothetical protein N2510_01785 [Ignavibacteria bacterium]|nr:hypothetical protein [Ignavibacteria bacterium]
MHSALALAKIELEEGILSTYFIHLHNMFYNAFEEEISSLLNEIFSMGHKPGLHFDCDYYKTHNETSLKEKLIYEKTLIENLTGKPCNVFSFHNPDEKVIERFSENSYAGMINTYGKYFRNIGYCSDSNGYWRFRRLEDVLNDPAYEKLQILIHPAWWQETPMSPLERIWRCIEGRADKIKEKYLEEQKKFGRIVISNDGEQK